jgi:quercetin dioxygenase-like cupin family protein
VHFVGRVDWSFADEPAPETATAAGLARRVLIGPAQGAAHTELAVGAMAPGGWLARHVHSFEEGLYVLEGELVLELDGHVHHLVAADYAVIPIAMKHALVTPPGRSARWLSINTPPRRPPDASVPDTVFATSRPDSDALVARAVPLAQPDVTRRYVGHYEGTPPQQEALRLSEPARGRRPAGIDTALIAYSGISVKMLIDRVLGADHMTLFTVDYEIGGAAQSHDHPFEETYFFLSGEVEAELDGIAYTLVPGDVVFAGVASVHGFWNAGSERVRWLETQAPQPPARGSYRWEPTWQRMAAQGVERWPVG